MTTTKPREKLTRDRDHRRGAPVMDAEGLEAVSMRRVAREVGVEAMSLYHHVRDKDDLLQGVCDRVMAGFEFPSRRGDVGGDGARPARAPGAASCRRTPT